MKLIELLPILLIIGALLPSCTGDIEDLEDPREAIAKKWNVTDNTSPNAYWVTINKDEKDKTKIFFSGDEGFHNLELKEILYATMVGKSIKIYPQTVDGYQIKGTGKIADDLESINFSYTVKPGDDPVEGPFTAEFGKVITSKSTKKKAIP